MAAEPGADLRRAQEHLRAIGGGPRAAGSEADRAARRHAANVLAAAGFAIREAPFSYSALPGRFGTPLVGGAMVFTIASAGHVGARGAGWAALAILLVAAILLGIVGRWLAREGVLDLPLMRASDVNLVATRGGAPRVWLMAHTDSKSQPVPQALRALGVVALGLVWLAAVGLAAAQVAGAVAPSFPPWIALAVLAVASGLPVMLSFVGNRSDGALDNASGVAAVLLAAEQLPRELPIGVVITTAEELGLAGARAWVRGQGRPARVGQIALNCDGVDDVGMLTVMHTGRRPARVLATLEEVAESAGLELRTMRLVPGILVDAVALADAGWDAVTVSRGTMATLARVHTAHDTLARLEGRGIPDAAAVLAGAARRLAREGDL